MPATLIDAPPPPRLPAITTLIDPERDDLIPVRTIAKQRLGKTISPACLWRWVRKGVRGCRLEAVNVMGTWHTTPAAFGAFITAQTASVYGAGTALEQSCGRSPAQAERLRKAGLLKSTKPGGLATPGDG